MGAFHDDPALKAGLLKMLDAGQVPPAADPVAALVDVVAWAEAAGLDAALGLLLSYLARGEEEAPGAFLRRVIAAIVPGGETLSMPHRWVVWAWRDAQEPLHALMRSPQAEAAGTEAIALHLRAAQDLEVGRPEWRSVRTRLGRLAEGDDDQALAAGVMAASAWDYRTAPGSAADTASALDKLQMSRIYRDAGWGDAQRAEVQQLIGDQKIIAETRIGPTPEGAGEAEAAAYRKRLTEELIGLINQLDTPLLRRNAELSGLVNAAFKTQRAQSKAALLSLVAALIPTAA